MTEHDDEALNRLRAADPAIGAHPDLQRVRAGLAGVASLGGDADRAVPVTDPMNRRTRWPLAAAAAIAAVSLGVGGYTLGASQAERPVVAGDDAADADGAETDTDPEVGLAEAALREEALSGGDGMAAGAEGEVSSDSGYGWSEMWGPVVLTAGDGLSDERTTGEVRAPQALDVDPEQLLGDVAAARGIEGEITEMDGQSWSVVDGPVAVHVNRWGSSLDVSYTDYTADPYCAEMAQEAELSEEEMAEEPGWFGPRPDDCREVGPAPDEETALAESSDLLEDLGVDLSTVRLEVEDYGVSYTMEMEGPLSTADVTTVTEAPASQDDGQDPGQDAALSTAEVSEPVDVPVDYAMPTVEVTVYGAEGSGSPDPKGHVSVSSVGVSSAYVSLVEHVSLGDYPVISAQEAVERFMDPRFAQGTFSLPFDEQYYSEEMYSELEVPQPVQLEAGDPLPYPVREATVVEAELVQGTIHQPDGTNYVVPGYRLTDDRGQQYGVLGLAEEALDLTP